MSEMQFTIDDDYRARLEDAAASEANEDVMAE